MKMTIDNYEDNKNDGDCNGEEGYSRSYEEKIRDHGKEKDEYDHVRGGSELMEFG